MSLEKKDYRKRLIDDKIDRYLKIFGAISIQGPKWCGKTWTSLKHANSVSYMTEKSPRDLAKVDPKYIFNQDRPQLIDEWQLVPSIWDAVRHECDSDHDKGKFILTGSTSLSKEEREDEIFHSGTGRIAIMKMNPMSLYESGDSTGDVSIEEMFSGNVNCKYIRKVELDELAKLIIRGGWPENIDKEGDDIEVIPRSYIESVITRDINERKDKKRDSNKMRMLFLTFYGYRMSQFTINKIVKRAYRKAELDENVYTVHTLRHTCATLLYRSGVNIKTIQELLGHVHIDTTEIYTHLDNQEVKDVMFEHPLAQFKMEDALAYCA